MVYDLFHPVKHCSRGITFKLVFLVGSVIPNQKEIKYFWVGDFLAVWWLRLSTSKAGYEFSPWSG